MKLLSVAVPCYNSEAYMDKCIESLLAGGEDVEILIIDDGSTKDRTAEIADEYQRKYPTIVKAIHQENKGHGGAVNTGVENATGVYFKVVDSDDWVDEGSLLRILKKLDELVKGRDTVDVFLSNFVYEKVGKKKKRIMRFLKNLPQDEVFRWNESKPFDTAHYVLMHNIIYRTELIRESGLKLPEHTFYVDNIYAFIPMGYAKTLYYTNENFYRYYIGRDDQSVNEKVMMSRIDQQYKVNEIMIDHMASVEKKLKGRCKDYMMHSLGIIVVVTSIMLMRINTEESLERKKELWRKFRDKCPDSYRKLRHSIIGRTLHLPGKAGRKFTLWGYRTVNRVYGFN